MLYFLHGSDIDKAREKAREMVAGLLKKRPGAEVFRMDSEGWSEARLDELIHGQGLFNRSYIIQTVHLFEDAEAEGAFLKKLPAIAKSPNIFIAVEGEVLSKTLIAVTEVAEKVQAFSRKGEKKRPSFNIFSLTDAFGRRDKKNLWVLFRKAVANGAVPEEIHGLLFWQLKSILLAHLCKTAEEAHVKPFVWSKAKSFAKNWSEPELKELSSKMVSLYHDSHRGIHDFGIGLERLILTL